MQRYVISRDGRASTESCTALTRGLQDLFHGLGGVQGARAGEYSSQHLENEKVELVPRAQVQALISLSASLLSQLRLGL